MKRFISVFAFLLVAVTLTSCFNTRILYGDIKREEPLVEINRVAWTHGFLFGLIPGNNAVLDAEAYVGNRDNFVVKTNQSFINILVGGLTCGIYTPTQTVFYAPLNEVSK